LPHFLLINGQMLLGRKSPMRKQQIPSVPAMLGVAAQKMNRRCLAGRKRDTVSRLDLERA
jgi:hypothetical protein